MKLPKNPTEAQILAVTGLVIKSIYTRGTVAVQTLDLDSQGRLTGIFLGDGVRFRYTIDNGILSYAPVNPKDLPSEEGVSLSEDALDFARLKIAGNTKQEKKCKVGYACGYSCISQNKVCNKALPGQAKNGAEWVKMQKEKETPTGSRPPFKFGGKEYKVTDEWESVYQAGAALQPKGASTLWKSRFYPSSIIGLMKKMNTQGSKEWQAFAKWAVMKEKYDNDFHSRKRLGLDKRFGTKPFEWW